jgi:hypothetical protein
LLTNERFLKLIKTNEINAALLERLPSLDLPQCHLTAGCLFQTIWNLHSGELPTAMIKDYDVFYFDGSDLSWDAEDAVIAEVTALARGLGVTVEVKNQARVHLWYKERFGTEYPKLLSSTAGIDRYLISCTCVGIDVASGEVYAPNGFPEIERGVLRMNPRNPNPPLFLRKARDYQRRWPWLEIIAPFRPGELNP